VDVDEIIGMAHQPIDQRVRQLRAMLPSHRRETKIQGSLGLWSSAILDSGDEDAMLRLERQRILRGTIKHGAAGRGEIEPRAKPVATSMPFTSRHGKPPPI